jgi:ubiquitin-conjugating enzyme E2 O
MLITDRVDLELRVGDIVKLKNKEGVPVTHHGVKGTEPGTITIDALWVTRTESHIDVLWQDGKRETLKSVDLIPYLNPDEYDCWYVE